MHRYSEQLEKMKVIEAREFANVAGRAGRAFIDIEGLIVKPLFNSSKETRAWKELLDKLHERELSSGLAQAIIRLVQYLEVPSSNLEQFIEYLANTDMAWISRENPEIVEACIDHLDHALISLLEPLEVSENALTAVLDSALQRSLFQFTLERQGNDVLAYLKGVLEGRARYIWRRSEPQQRIAWRTAGTSFRTGLRLSALFDELVPLLLTSEQAIAEEDAQRFSASIAALAKILLAIPPFAPRKMPKDWEPCLNGWLSGESLAKLMKQFPEAAAEIESLFRYRLVWAIDTLRALALEKDPEAYKNLKQSVASLAVETGLISVRAARLVSWGLPSRLTAIKLAEMWDSGDKDKFAFLEWLEGKAAQKLLSDTSWPTQTAHKLVVDFVQRLKGGATSLWHSRESANAPVKWRSSPPKEGYPLRLINACEEGWEVATVDFKIIGNVDPNFYIPESGKLTVTACIDDKNPSISIDYIGPGFLGSKNLLEMMMEDKEAR